VWLPFKPVAVWPTMPPGLGIGIEEASDKEGEEEVAEEAE
jgi:hypothetical protein